jgi:hypothetical protein
VTAQRPDASAVVIDLEHRLAQAWVSRDRPFIDGLLASDWTVTDPSGRILTKQQVLDETFSSTERRSMPCRSTTSGFRCWTTWRGHGRTRATGTYQGQKSNVLLRFTDVFHFRDGRWQIVASQGTLIAP